MPPNTVNSTVHRPSEAKKLVKKNGVSKTNHQDVRINNNNNNNKKEILCDGHYYDVTDFAQRHPGGRIIDFYTENGEDATVAIQQFHHRSIKKVGSIMASLRRRPAPPGLDMLGGQMDPERQKRNVALTEDFNKLFIELEQEGFFKPSATHLAYRIGELLTLVGVAIFCLQEGFSLLSNFIGIVSCGFFLGRCGWLMHEAGHHSLTGRSKVDQRLQAVIVGLGTGLSSSYWSTQHNRHHAMPQRLQKDVDLNTMPLVAFNSKVIMNGEAVNKNFFVKHQAILFLSIDTMIVSLVWKLFLHPRYAFRKKKWGQLILMTLHYTLVYYMGLWAYLAGLWLGSIYMFGNFALSHTHLPVTEGPLHWVEYGLLHTMDIDSSWWCDWWMGYLNCQIEHHLFPTMPQFRNRQVKERVKGLAARHGIPYQSSSYWQAVSKTYKNLDHVSKELRHGS